MLYLCLRFPLLGLDALGKEINNDHATALIENGRLRLCNRAAQQQGLRPGISTGQAQALCPELHCVQRQPLREQDFLQRLALWAYRFSDDVSLCKEDALIIEVSRSKRLFGSVQRLHRRLLAAYQRHGLTVQQGLGPTPLCAELLSQSGVAIAPLLGEDGSLQRPAMKRQLAGLPCEVLPVSAKSHNALKNMGLRRVGEVLALPRKTLLSGFESAFCDAIDRLTGRREDLRPRFMPTEQFSGERTLNGGVQHSNRLRPAVDELLQELEIYLRLRQSLPQLLTWRFHYLNGHQEDWHTPLSLTHFDRQAVLALVMLQLDGWRLPSPVETLELQSDQLTALHPQREQLFSDAEQEQREARQMLFNKLRLRIGEHGIRRLQQQEDWLPEYQGVASPQASYRQGPHAATAALRPTVLLPEYQPLLLEEGLPSWQGKLELLQGPERIDSHWWQQRQVRDYYIARHSQQGLCWIFKDCLSQQWYLHGFFA